MKKRILWIDDDGAIIAGLFRPLVNDGFKVNNIYSANNAIKELFAWEQYDLIVMDFLLPLVDDNEIFEFLELFPTLENIQYIGAELIRYARLKLNANCPILALTIVENPLNHLSIQNLENIFSISKSSSPSRLSKEIYTILNSQELAKD